MKIYTRKQVIELCDAIANLERAGKRWLVDFGYVNAVEKWKELQTQKSKRPIFPKGRRGSESHKEIEQRFTEGTSTYDGQKCNGWSNVTNWH